jgi:hypothetical protein
MPTGIVDYSWSMLWSLAGAILASGLSLSRAVGASGFQHPKLIAGSALWRSRSAVVSLFVADAIAAGVVTILTPFVRLPNGILLILSQSPILGFVVLGFATVQSGLLVPLLRTLFRPQSSKSEGGPARPVAEAGFGVFRFDLIRQVANEVDAVNQRRAMTKTRTMLEAWRMLVPDRKLGIVDICLSKEWRVELPAEVCKEARKLKGRTDIIGAEDDFEKVFALLLNYARWEVAQSVIDA